MTTKEVYEQLVRLEKRFDQDPIRKQVRRNAHWMSLLFFLTILNLILMVIHVLRSI